MKPYIALLRGINVGGHKKFPKADQLKMVKDLGFQNPQVYLHTGNWIFTSDKSCANVATEISSAILHKYGWDVPVLVRTVSGMEQIMKKCPLTEELQEKSYFILLQTAPSASKVALLDEISYPGEIFHYTEDCIYFYPAIGAGKAKMSTNFFENKLKVNATARNFRTMTKLLALGTTF